MSANGGTAESGGTVEHVSRETFTSKETTGTSTRREKGTAPIACCCCPARFCLLIFCSIIIMWNVAYMELNWNLIYPAVIIVAGALGMIGAILKKSGLLRFLVIVYSILAILNIASGVILIIVISQEKGYIVETSKNLIFIVVVAGVNAAILLYICNMSGKLARYYAT
ncbi:unnamed protein product [Cylicocyclus nassatus]|uniref:Uncharacterized protein n=1 Tax=Cylicocyclus nassatus TaxID=53992 RepID=A0AA36M512_CYLNA|nr:unnamed protein product [Cylicocyclus nassatus]